MTEFTESAESNVECACLNDWVYSVNSFKKMLSELREAVRARLDVVADHALRDSDPAAHLDKLKQAAVRLDTLVADLPANCDPMLRHYLERQSYTKALAWLEEQSPS